MTTIYAQSMALQSHLDSLPKANPNNLVIAKIGLEVINDRWDPLRTRVARSTSAYFINDGSTTESFVLPPQLFEEIVLKGQVPRVSCIEIAKRLVVSLPFYNAEVLGPTQELESTLIEHELENYDTVLPIDLPIKRPLYTPVEDLGFIAIAA